MKLNRPRNLQVWVPTIIGLVITFTLPLLLFLHSDRVSHWLSFLENHASDLSMRYLSRPLPKDLPLLIVYIDDRSLKEEGRWPWPRKKMAELATQLHQLGASVVAYDMVFPEKEQNIGNEVLSTLEKKSKLSEEVINELKQAQEAFNYDAVFAESLKNGTSVLGVVFTRQGISEGVLPPPCLILSEQMANEAQFVDMNSYISNIEPLQSAAKYGGFINGFPDFDGIYRYSPLLVQLGNKAYCSLGLQAVSLYLSTPQFILQSHPYQNEMVLEGISLGDRSIPTTSHGEILIPYRRKGSRFNSVSATDVMKAQVKRDQVANKIVFVGFSASALGDLVSTPISPLVPGVDLHATIAAGILDGYLPFKPTWGKGVTVALVFILGLFSSLVFPRLGSITGMGLALSIVGLLLFMKRWIWIEYEMIFFLTFPIVTIMTIYTFTTIFGYFFESKRLQQVRGIFDQYVPAAHVELLCKKELSSVLKGENKELTVLFSDIRGFTTISESINASQLKELLDLYLTPMTQVIFEHQGTIDKYIGDAIMAFWGAPLPDAKNALHAVETALHMQRELGVLNQMLKVKNMPPIKIGIGINTGRVHVGDMGSHFRRAYTVIGDAVNLASRLEGLTKTYYADVLVGETTEEQTKLEVLYRNLGKVLVKGKTNYVNIYQPICLIKDATDKVQSELQSYHEAFDLVVQKKGDLANALFQKLIAAYPENQLLYEGVLDRMKQEGLNS